MREKENTVLPNSVQIERYGDVLLLFLLSKESWVHIGWLCKSILRFIKYHYHISVKVKVNFIINLSICTVVGLKYCFLFSLIYKIKWVKQLNMITSHSRHISGILYNNAASLFSVSNNVMGLIRKSHHSYSSIKRYCWSFQTTSNLFFQ